MKKIIIAMLMAIISIGMGQAQLTSSFPPKSYPASILVVTDPGVAQYWDVKRIMYLGPGNGGHKFRVYGSAKADHRAANVDMYYIRLDDKLQSAGAYFFPEVKKGEAFNFDIVSAFPGYAPSSFLGFMIKDDLFTMKEQERPKSPDDVLKSIQVTQIQTVGDPEDGTMTGSSEEIRTSRINNNIVTTPLKDYEDTTIYFAVDERAHYAKGEQALSNWMRSNRRYPERAMRKGLEERVFVNVVVEKDGSITRPKIVHTTNQDPNGDFSKEALRLIMTMPKWEPGIKDGVPVRQGSSIIIDFSLPKK